MFKLQKDMIPYLVYQHMTRNNSSTTPETSSTAMAGEPARPATPPSPPSPSASFYDMSDDEEGEYNTIRHTRSERGVKLLFSKSKVCHTRIVVICRLDGSKYMLSMVSA